MTNRRIHTVDVFTTTPFMGNPVAVILDGGGRDGGGRDGSALTTAQMQGIANWTNLSETTFVLPATDPAADYSLRIFTPRAELPFAGHPTIGSAYAILSAGLAEPHGGKLVQQCGVGLVEIAVPGDWRSAGLSFRLPPASLTPAPEPDRLAAALGATPLAPPMIVNVGPRWVIVEVEDGGVVDGLQPDYAALADYDRRHGTTGLTVFGHSRDAAGTQIVRSFAPADGINEDPVCGSGNGAVAAYRQALAQTGEGDSYTAFQGHSVGRAGQVRLRYAADGIHVGGCAVVCVEGLIVV